MPRWQFDLRTDGDRFTVDEEEIFGVAYAVVDGRSEVPSPVRLTKVR